jgi:uncharacterized membrane protein YhaH (DUF805 family)
MLIFCSKLILAANLLVIPGTALAKLVLCVVYYRLSPMPWYRYVIYGTSVLMVVAFTSVWFSLLLACKPVEAAWNLRLFTGSNCIGRYPVHILQASIGGAADLVLMVITFITILPLQMSREKKAAAIAFLSTGLLTLGAAVARLVILVTRLKDPDTTFVLAQGTLCLIVETNLVIICGSLPNFRIFIKHMLGVFAKPQSQTDREINGVQGSSSEAVVLYTIGGTPMDGGESGPGASDYNNSKVELIPQDWVKLSRQGC